VDAAGPSLLPEPRVADVMIAAAAVVLAGHRDRVPLRQRAGSPTAARDAMIAAERVR
jgi:hypothetical protein